MGIGKCMEDYLLLIIWFVTIHGPYSARYFRAYFARKSRVARLDAMKSKFFTTINGVFAVSVHRGTCYCSRSRAFQQGRE